MGVPQSVVADELQGVLVELQSGVRFEEAVQIPERIGFGLCGEDGARAVGGRLQHGHEVPGALDAWSEP